MFTENLVSGVGWAVLMVPAVTSAVPWALVPGPVSVWLH